MTTFRQLYMDFNNKTDDPKGPLVPFLAFSGEALELNWVKAYEDNYKSLDLAYIFKKHGSLVVDDLLTLGSSTGNRSAMGSFLASSEDLERMFNALYSEYNPLWNVDGIETTTHSETDIKRFDERANERTIAGKVTNTQTGNVENSHKEGLNFDPDTKVETLNDKTTYNSLKNETAYSNDYKETNEQKGAEVTEYGHVITVERHGNIGVTKTTELIGDTVALYMVPFWDRVFDRLTMFFGMGYYDTKGLTDEERQAYKRYVINEYNKDISAEVVGGDLILKGDF